MSSIIATYDDIEKTYDNFGAKYAAKKFNVSLSTIYKKLKHCENITTDTRIRQKSHKKNNKDVVKRDIFNNIIIATPEQIKKEIETRGIKEAVKLYNVSSGTLYNKIAYDQPITEKTIKWSKFIKEKKEIKKKELESSSDSGKKNQTKIEDTKEIKKDYTTCLEQGNAICGSKCDEYLCDSTCPEYIPTCTSCKLFQNLCKGEPDTPIPCPSNNSTDKIDPGLNKLVEIINILFDGNEFYRNIAHDAISVNALLEEKNKTNLMWKMKLDLRNIIENHLCTCM